MKIFTLFSFLIIFFNAAYSQLSINSNQNPNDLVEQIFLGTGIDINNVTYTGYESAIGSFSYSGSHFPVSQGVLLTTGRLTNFSGPEGPNDEGGSGYSNFAGSCHILDSILGSAMTMDACVLEMDFIPMGDSVFFNYSFASEEYPEFVNSDFNDIFGLFISGPGINGQQNIALLPDMNFVSINNVNSGMNSAYFINNGNGQQSPYNTDPEYIQFNGFTTLLTAKSAVIPGENYHLTIAIADVFDEAYDSGIFLEAQSLKSIASTSKVIEKENGFQVYPNPAHDKVYFRLPYQGNFQAKIKNFTGQIIQDNLSVGNSQPLNISPLEAGIYLVEIITPTGKMTQKIIKN